MFIFYLFGTLLFGSLAVGIFYLVRKNRKNIYRSGPGTTSPATSPPAPAKSKWSGWKVFGIIIIIAFILGLVPWGVAVYNEIFNQDLVQLEQAKKVNDWYLMWEKPAGYDGYNKHQRSLLSRANVEFGADTVVVELYRSNTFSVNVTFSGKKENPGDLNCLTYVGKWAQIDPAIGGDFRFEFRRKDKNNANSPIIDGFGWLTWSDAPVRTEVKTMLYRR
jgi:hypothetical protein